MSDAPSTPRPHLILIHGAGVGPWMWDAQRAHFADDFAVHTPTMPGHGPGRGDFISQAHAAQAIASELSLETLQGDVTVVGFSLGGQVAVELATLFPHKVARTVIVSSLLRPWRLASLYVRAAVAAAPMARSEKFARAQAKQLYLADHHFDAYFALSSGMSKASLGNIIRTNFSFTPSSSFIASERSVLIIARSEEQRRLREDSARLAHQLRRSEFVLVEGVAHGASLARPAEFNAILGEWLAANHCA